MSTDEQALTVSGFQALIRQRYLETDKARGWSGTFAWFIEEVGELASALGANNRSGAATEAERANLEEEFADVLAWLATLANVSGVDLASALTKYTVEGRVEGVKE